MIYDTQHKMTLSKTTFWHFARCGILFVVILDIIMLSFIVLSVVAPLVELLTVVVPFVEPLQVYRSHTRLLAFLSNFRLG
jgi:hypothetical protein